MLQEAEHEFLAFVLWFSFTTNFMRYMKQISEAENLEQDKKRIFVMSAIVGNGAFCYELIRCKLLKEKKFKDKIL